MREVRSKRVESQLNKNNGLVIQFTISCLLRILDSTSALLYLHDAWNHAQNWTKVEVCDTGNTSYIPKAIREECDAEWSEGKADDLLWDYRAALITTVFFNVISMVVFLVHLFSWVVTLKRILSADVTDYAENRLTRLTQSTMISLSTAIIRDIPISSLNSELLVLRSGREGLTCLRCMCGTSCPVQSTVYVSLKASRELLDFSYGTILVTSFWKGLVGLYRVTRTEQFDVHVVRACVAFGFAFLYSAIVFTPAMLLMIFRYFTIPGYDEPFLHDIFSRIVVIGITGWVLVGNALLCCPLLYLIRLK